MILTNLLIETPYYTDEDIEFEDEMRIGTRTQLGRKWTPIGVRPVGRQQIGYQYVYLYVSLKPFTGEMFALFLPRPDKECFGIFIAERSLQLKRRTLFVADGATAHRLGENDLVEARQIAALRAGTQSGGEIL